MALSKKQIARKVLNHSSIIGMSLNEEQILQLESDNIITIDGQICKVANVMTNSRYNVTVNKDWFGNRYNKEKPFFKSNNRGPKIEFDCILFPSRNNLFIISYLQLRECCLALQLERDKWFRRSTWGVELDESSGTFRWAGGNNIKFNLVKIEQDGVASPFFS